MSPPDTPSPPGAVSFVWSVWAAATVIALAYVARYGADVPRWDDYAVIPQLCGREPISFRWLWSQHSEHRIPIARVILLAVFKLDGAAPLPVLLLNVVALAVGGASLLLGIASARGGSRYVDALLPLMLLHLGHHQNFLWAIQITYILPVALLCIATALATASGPILGARRAAAIGVCLAVMPLCNAGGLLMTAPPILWLLATGAAVYRSGDRKRGVQLAACAMPAAILGGAYFVGYASPSHHAAPGGPAAAVRSTVQFLATGFGTPGLALWPWLGGATAGLLAAAGAALAAAWCRRPNERTRVGGLLAMLGSVGLLALATGWGRSGEGAEAGLQLRYATLAAPAPAVVYLAFLLYGGRRLGTIVGALLLATASLALWPNARDAFAAGRESREQARAFDVDRDAGAPAFRLASRHVPFLHPSRPMIHDLLEMLRTAQIGKFSRISPDPTFREQAVDPRPADVRMGRWDGETFHATGPDPWLRFDLSAPQRVAGVRIRYDHHNDDGAPARFRLGWRPTDRYNVPEAQYGEWNLATGEDRTTTIWLDEPVARLRIQPDNRPCRFRIRELTLLIEP